MWGLGTGCAASHRVMRPRLPPSSSASWRRMESSWRRRRRRMSASRGRGLSCQVFDAGRGTAPCELRGQRRTSPLFISPALSPGRPVVPNSGARRDQGSQRQDHSLHHPDWRPQRADPPHATPNPRLSAFRITDTDPHRDTQGHHLHLHTCTDPTKKAWPLGQVPSSKARQRAASPYTSPAPPHPTRVTTTSATITHAHHQHCRRARRCPYDLGIAARDSDTGSTIVNELFNHSVATGVAPCLADATYTIARLLAPCVSVQHIPAHQGHPWNELADIRANAAAA